MHYRTSTTSKSKTFYHPQPQTTTRNHKPTTKTQQQTAKKLDRTRLRTNEERTFTEPGKGCLQSEKEGKREREEGEGTAAGTGPPRSRPRKSVLSMATVTAVEVGFDRSHPRRRPPEQGHARRDGADVDVVTALKD